MSEVKIKGTATIEDLLRVPKNGMKHELVDGEIVVSPAGMRHSAVAVKIAGAILTFLEDHPIGEVYAADVGIILPDGNVRSPDVTFVSLGKLPGGQSPDTFGAVIPDLAVEVISPSDSSRFVGEKIGEYLENGVPIVWLVDPRLKTITIYRSLQEAERLTATDTITAEPILPGFSCPISRFF